MDRRIKSFLNKTKTKNMSPFTAELIGTMLLILLGNGMVDNVLLKNTKGNNSGWLVITTAWALAVFVGVTVAGPVSGAHLNPAITIALAVLHKFSWDLVPVYISAQIIGAMLGAFLVWIFYRLHFNITEDDDAVEACFCTSPAIKNTFSNLLSEIIGAFVLMFVVLYIASPTISIATDANAKIGLGTIGAIPVAFLVWVIGLALGGTTGYAINPARDLGPRIVHSIIFIKRKNNWSYAWIPVAGPFIGALIAAGLYLLIN
jgi:glycerol uptake facilitator protein